MLKFTKNENGFTLMEIVIAAGLLGFLALAFMKYQQNQIKSTKTNINKTELNNYFQGMKAYMGKPGTCKRTFEKLGRLENRLIVEKILRPDGEAKYSLEEKVAGTNYILSSMYISDLFVNKIEDRELHRGEAVLNVELTRINNASYGAKKLNKSFEIDMYVDNENKISDCGVLGGLYLPLGPSVISNTQATNESQDDSSSESVSSADDSSSESLSSKDDMDKVFQRSIQEASQKTGQQISQEDIKKAVQDSPELQKAMESLKVLQESNKKMEALMNEEF
ncbi:type II secretion system protein [Halobacteriovorax sp. DPLXC-1]|uniref:type II secretion system protein n=1 Tax=Halobacteriovorax sp. DPLXC-1 TaxID=3110771 RepID=UPI002FF0CC29